MSMKDYLADAWQQHGDDPEGVHARLPEGLALATEAADLAQLAGLIVHVAGEHLGRWDEGLELLHGLTTHAVFDGTSAEGKAVRRSMAILCHCAGDEEGRAKHAALGRSDHREESDAVRMLAVGTSALAAQGRMVDALADFGRALELASYGPTADDPAARSLAVTGHNLACSLEEKVDRTPDEARLLLTAAETSRKYWAIAGTWLEVERAEYRLGMTFLALGEPRKAVEHARLCRAGCHDNDALPGECFFPEELLARCAFALGNQQEAAAHRDEAARLLSLVEDEGFASFCRSELAKLDAHLKA